MTELHLAAALNDAGWHPAAWRDPSARPSALFTAGYWGDLAAEAERGLLDFVTIEDALGPPAPPGGVTARLDAVLIAARLAPATSRIGLVPATVVQHTEPFHVSIGIASLDHASRGRAGWRPDAAPAHHAHAPHFGRRDLPDAALLGEAAEFAEVVRRLWDSWEDDAEIRDTATGRFLDREKLHYIDFEGEHLRVRGPSITPRPPQGQPPVTVLADDVAGYELAARAADVVLVAPRSRGDAVTVVAQVREAERTVERTGEPLRVLGDLVVFLDAVPGAAHARLARLDGLARAAFDAEVFTGTPGDLADLLLDWREAGLDGFRLRPGVLPADLAAITRELVPILRGRGAFRESYGTATLRGHLGLPRPANRYAVSDPGRRP
ncbi:LLM class flavin-dependent oxidoreductase [Actinomadura sp. NEAU-AAG7]|uniref:LLM class flavin-dependent oxidoreductase n=1 Tax=Actinomadura sp. NEAU-AAG7 TaxID=2839640 RepID=UPI001BE3F4C4|nr:LLM class flavin-dependent oxidoreductase [Actinomadura sp. NEAU-AAG7]MBT2207957.1 LLM class flavin-dependent oxidoreductase [Actinomadura sp. NEAU-AAG7]